MAATVSNQKILNDGETVDGGLMAPCRRGESADSEISSDVSSDERFINKCVPPPRAFANSKENKDEGGKRRGTPKLDCRLAKSSSDAASAPPSPRTRSLDISSLGNRTSFRIQGIDGEFDEIWPSLGLSGPDDFSTPAAACEARKFRSSLDLPQRSRLHQKILNDDETVDGGLMAPCRRGESADSEISSNVSSDERFINKYVPPPRAFANSKENKDEGVCSFVDSMTSISSTDFDALDNRAHLGRAYHSGPIVFNSEKKDTREGLSGECLTKSALSFDDSTKRKWLPVDVNLSSFSEHASQDFDDFDFVGFDYGAGMLPNLMDELDSLREKPLVDFDSPNIKAHGLLVFNSEEKNTREASTRRCMTESVCSLVDSMPSISSTDLDALDNRSHLGRAYQSGPIVFNLEMGSTKSRLVRCPKCLQLLRELANVPVYMCGGCNTVLQAKKRKNDTKDKDLQKPDTNMGKKTELEQDSEDKEAQNSSKEDKEARSLSKEETLSSSGELPLDRNNGSDDKENENSNMNQSGLAHHGNEESSPEAGVDQDKCSLKHNNEGDPNEYAQSNGKYIGGVNLLDEVASPTEPNHHKSAESEVDKSGNCLEEENGGVNFSDEVASSTELNHLGREESSPVAGAHSEVDENNNCLEQEVVSSTELNNNEIEVSSPVVRAYSEANENGICNGKQTGGVNISDEVVSSTELNDNEIKVSSLVVVTAHSEANEHKTCMEQNNGMNQSEFGDFKLDCSKNTKSSGEIFSSTELTCREIEESTPVIETNAQLKKLSTRRLTLEFEERLDDFMAPIQRRDCWEPMTLETIKTPAMDPGSEDVISDFMTFVNGKKIYKRKGKTWKRGYLLYEPPGSDGASLIAAMADFLEFKLYNLDLASFSSFSELKNTLLVGTWSSSVIAIRDLDDFDHCAGMLPNLKNELIGSCLLEFVSGLLSSCGDEQIIVFTTNNRDHHDAARRRRFNEDIYVHKSSPQPVALADKGEIVQLDSSRQKPLVDFEATNIKAYQSSLLVSNSEEKNTREASTRRCMTESVCSFVDSMPSISSTDFDALDNRAHLGRAYHSGPIVFNSKKKDMREGLSGECLTKSALSFDDSTKRKSLPFDVNLSSFSEHTSQDFDDFDFVGFDYGAGMLPNLKDESTSPSCWPIGLPDGGHIDPLDPLVQYTTNIEHAARADQCSPTESCAEKKMVRKTLKRMCRTMSVIFEENHQHFARRCKGAAKSLGAMRIFRKHGINQVSPVKRIHKQHGIRQWPFRQKGRGILGEMKDHLKLAVYYMDEKLDSRLQFIHMSKFARSSPRALTLPDGGEIVGPVALSLSKFAATNNRAHLVKQDQSGSTASHYECKNTRETSDKQGLEDLKRHFGCKDKDAVKSLGVSVSMFKSTCRQHWVYCWPGQFENNEQQAFDATNNRAHLVKADESGPTVSNSEKGSTREGLKRDCLTNALSLEDLRQHFGARHKDAAEGLCDSPAWKSFEVLDSLPLGERSNSIRYLARQRTLTHKHCVRLKKSQDLLRSLQRDCSGGLAPQSDIGLPDGGHILSFSEKKIVRKTLKRKCRTMSVRSLEDHQHHVGWRWEDAVNFLGTKRIHRQLGTCRWPFKQTAIGLSDGGHILSLSEKKIVRKTLMRKCRSMSVFSLEDHKQHVDGRWEDAVKSHGAKRICRQLVIHHLSTAKRIRKQHGIHRWPFQQFAVGLPDGHILPLSEKKIVRTTLKRKCRSMSVLSLVDRQQHVDRRWEDAVKNIGAKRICRQLVIHCVSIAKRIYRQHGIYHRWPFQHDLATMKGYSLGDERPVEVISLSTHVKLVSRLQLIYISWLGRFSPQPSALAGGGEIGGPIALSLSESAATKNIAQHVGQDQSGSAASDSENERTREQGDPEEINATITLHDIRRHYGRRNREDAAASLAISVSTFKRKCREYGIKRWPHVRKRKVGRPPDQHGEGNTSTAHETPLHYVQTGMEGELVGQNEVANVFQIDFMGGPIALNTESGLIMVSRPPDQHGERNTSTACRTPSRNVETGMEVEPVGQNQEANVFHGDFMYGPIALNTDGLTFPECSDAVAPSQPMSTILDTIPHLTGSSSECAFQVKNQSTQFTANPYPNGLVDPHPQIALTQILSENMERLEDRRNLLAPQKEPLPEGHVFGSVNWTVRSCSDVALSQPMPTIPHTTGCSEYWRNSLALLEEHLLEENDYGSINLTAPSCFDPGPSQPMHTIPHTMPTIPQMIPLLTERQDMRSVRLKATYGNTIIKFPLPSGFSELKEEVSKRLEFERGSFKLEYKDEEGDSVLIACDEDLRDYLQLLTSLGNQVVKLFVLDKVPNTTNFCDNCRSLKCKRT